MLSMLKSSGTRKKKSTETDCVVNWQTVQEFDRPGAPIAAVKMSNLNVEMANRLHNRPMPERKEMIKMTLDQMKRMK
jgi:hypothetical protein